MRVRLLRDARIRHHAGEIVEVSPAEYDFLIGVGSAERAEEPKEKSEEPTATRKKRK